VTRETDCQLTLLLGAQTDNTIFYVREKDLRNYAENIWGHVAKFSPPNDQVPWIYAVLLAPFSDLAFAFTTHISSRS